MLEVHPQGVLHDVRAQVPSGLQIPERKRRKVPQVGPKGLDDMGRQQKGFINKQ